MMSPSQKRPKTPSGLYKSIDLSKLNMRKGTYIAPIMEEDFEEKENQQENMNTDNDSQPELGEFRNDRPLKRTNTVLYPKVPKMQQVTPKF